MSLPKLTPTDLDTLVFKRFRAVFNLSGAWAMKDDPTTFAAEWLRVLQWSSPAEVKRGVDAWLASGKDKWPTPGQLFHQIQETQPKRVYAAKVEAELEQCPCGTAGCGWHFYDLRPGVYRLKQDCVAQRDGLTRHSFQTEAA